MYRIIPLILVIDPIRYILQLSLLIDRFPKVFYHFVDFSVEILYSKTLYNYNEGFNEHVHDPYLAFILKALTSLNTVMIHRFFILAQQPNHSIQLLDVNVLLYSTSTKMIVSINQLNVAL